MLPLEWSTATTSCAGSTAGSGGTPSVSSAENDVAPSASPNTMISSTFVRAVTAVALTTSAGMVTSRRAPVSFRWAVRSSAVSSGLSTTTVPPARAAAWNAIGYAGTFGARRANTSPLPKPRA